MAEECDWGKKLRTGLQNEQREREREMGGGGESTQFNKDKIYALKT